MLKNSLEMLTWPLSMCGNVNMKQSMLSIMWKCWHDTEVCWGIVW